MAGGFVLAVVASRRPQRVLGVNLVARFQRFKSFVADDVQKDCPWKSAISWFWPLKANSLFQERPVLRIYLTRESHSGAADSMKARQFSCCCCLLLRLQACSSGLAAGQGHKERPGVATWKLLRKRGNVSVYPPVFQTWFASFMC